MAVIIVVLVLIVAAVAGFYYIHLTSPSNAGQLGPWNPTTSYPLFPQDFSCVSSGGYAYCVGGYSGTTPLNGVGDLNLTYYAHLSSDGVSAWMRTTDYPIGIQDQSCVARESYVYCVGGYEGGQANRNIADAYYASLSPSGIGNWSRTTSYPYPAGPRCMTDSSFIYCVGAHYNGTAYTRTIDAFFAPLSAGGVGNWIQSPGPPSSTAGCSASGGYAFCFGGGNCPPPGDCSSPSYYARLSSNGVSAWSRTADLPTAVWAGYVTADANVYYLSIPTFFAPVSSDGVGAWKTTTNYPDSVYPAGCVASGTYIYCVGGSTPGGQNSNSVYYTEVGSPNPSALQLQNPPPFQNPVYLVPAASPSASGECSVSVNGTFAGAPCFDRNIDYAVVFDCAAAAATPSGCTTTVVSPADTTYNYKMTIWYPYTNQSLPDVNCAFLPALGWHLPIHAWCISTGTNSFIVSQSSP